MTKRIVAILLALVLSLTMFAIPTFADADITFTEGESNKITATWLPVTNAAKYEVEVNLSGSKIASSTVTADTTKESFSYSWTASSAGTYAVNVIVRDAANNILATKTGSHPVVIETTKNNLTFERADGSVKVSWTAPENVTVTKYTYSYTIAGSSAVEMDTTNTDVTVNVAKDKAVTVTVWYGTAEGGNKAGTIGSATLNANNTASGGSNPSTSTEGYISFGANYTTLNGRVLDWSALNAPTHSYAIYHNGNYYTTTTNTSYTVPTGVTKAEVKWNGTTIVIAHFGTSSSSGTQTGTGTVTVTPGTRNVTWTSISGATYYIYGNGALIGTSSSTTYKAPEGCTSVRIEYVLNGNTYVMGTVTLPIVGNSTGTSSGTSTSGTVYVSAGTRTVRWTPVAGATYTVYANGNMIGDTTNTYYNAPDGYTSVTVHATVGTTTTTLGTVTLPIVGNSTGSTSGGTITSTTQTTNGTNCTVTSTSASATVKWTSSGSSYYLVSYTVGNTTKAAISYTTSITLPIGHSEAFSVKIYNANNSLIASASVKQQLGGTTGNITGATTQIKNLDLKFSGSSCIVSWDKVPGATMYYVMYGLYGSAGTYEKYPTTNSVEIPLSSKRNFVVYVYTFDSDGSLNSIGSATYIAGSKPSTDSDDSVSAVEGYDYVTNFAGTQAGSGIIRLTWDPAEDCDEYTVYYKKSTSDKWVKLYELEGRALRVKKLANGTKYDFKVVANGIDSSILTIAPHATKTETIVTDDPEIAEDVTTVPEIKSTSGGDGSATIKWSEVKDATQYKVFFASKNSTTYGCKATIKPDSDGDLSTAVKITGLSAGTYKVRVKALVDGEWTKLADCDYVSVTVK